MFECVQIITPSVVADKVSPKDVAVSTTRIFTFATAASFQNATSFETYWTADTGTTSSSVTLTPTWTTNGNQGTLISASFPQISTVAGTALIKVVGVNAGNSAIKSDFMSIKVYAQPTAITLSKSTCSVQLCDLVVTVVPAYVSMSSKLKLTHSTGSEAIFSPSAVTAGTMTMQLRSLLLGTYTATVSVDGTDYASPTASLTTTDPGPIKVCFMFLSGFGDYGWTYSHNTARLALEKEYSGAIVTSYKQYIPEPPFGANVNAGTASMDANTKKCYDAFKAFADEGCGLIIGTSFGYMDVMLNLSLSYPSNIKWLHISGYKTSSTLSTGFARMYQTRYLAGLVAGGQLALEPTPTCIAYVAAFSYIAEVVRQVNDDPT